MCKYERNYIAFACYNFVIITLIFALQNSRQFPWQSVSFYGSPLNGMSGSATVYIYIYILYLTLARPTGPDGAVVMSSANGLVGTGFASRYRHQPRAGF